MEIIYILAYGIIFFITGIFLFVLNLFIFDKLTGFDIKVDIFQIQNKALSYIVKGQIIGQAIMIGTLIYFLGTSYEKGQFNINQILSSIGDILIFGLFGIFIFQSLLIILDKIFSITKEIIIDNNESLGQIIEAILIGIAIILSVSLYSY